MDGSLSLSHTSQSSHYKKSPAGGGSLATTDAREQPQLLASDSGYSSEHYLTRSESESGKMGTLSVKTPPPKTGGGAASKSAAKSSSKAKKQKTQATSIPDGPRRQKPILTVKAEKVAMTQSTLTSGKGAVPKKKGQPTSRKTGGSVDSPNGHTDSFATEQPTTTRAGRAVAKRRSDQTTVYGPEYEALTKSSPIDKEYTPNSHPAVVQVPSEAKGKPACPPKHSAPSRDTQPVSVEEGEEEEEEETSFPASPQIPCFPLNSPIPASIDANIRALTSTFHTHTTTLLDLPTLEFTTSSPPQEQPWTAALLTHLYIACYTAQLFPACDLIADTWIRAFQALNRSANPRTRIWRPNKRPYVDAAAPHQSYLDVQDPLLAPDVTDFDVDLLNALFEHTDTACGARRLWADAMALCGERIEEVMVRAKGKGVQWHRELVWEVMCSALRLGRRKLTLKIEEGTEGAWCARYHVHAQHGLRCYRQVAREERDEEAGKERGCKRSAGEMGGGNEGAKRVKLTNGQQDVEDEVVSEEEA